jgi:hypothetical protein
MTVKTKNRSHRVLYMVLVLFFAVALSTVLMMAGERGGGSEKKNGLENGASDAVSTDYSARTRGCQVA